MAFRPKPMPSGSQPMPPRRQRDPNRVREPVTFETGSPSQDKRTGSNWENGEYTVGKNRPPVHARWKPGQSGNPRGRKPNKPDMDEMVVDLMNRTIFMTNSRGEKVKITQASALLRKMYERAVKGGFRETKFLLEAFAKVIERKSDGDAPDTTLDADDTALLASMLEALGLNGAAPDPA